MLQTWSLSFPEVDFLVSYFAKPLDYGHLFTRIRKSLTLPFSIDEARMSFFYLMMSRNNDDTWANNLKISSNCCY